MKHLEYKSNDPKTGIFVGKSDITTVKKMHMETYKPLITIQFTISIECLQDAKALGVLSEVKEDFVREFSDYLDQNL